jgi:hypothetical protein
MIRFKGFIEALLVLVVLAGLGAFLGCGDDEKPGDSGADVSTPKSDASEETDASAEDASDGAPQCGPTGASCWDPDKDLPSSAMCCTGVCVQPAFERSATCEEE